MLRAYCILCFPFSNSIQCRPWMERHWWSERPSSSVWVAVEMTVTTVTSVSHSHKEFSLHRPRTERPPRAVRRRQAAKRISWLGRSGSHQSLVSKRLLPEPSVFTAASSGSTSVGPTCSNSPLVHPAAGTAGWCRFFSAARPGSTSVGPTCSNSPLLHPAAGTAGWCRFFSAARPGSTSVGPNCSDSLLLRPGGCSC